MTPTPVQAGDQTAPNPERKDPPQSQSVPPRAPRALGPFEGAPKKRGSTAETPLSASDSVSVSFSTPHAGPPTATSGEDQEEQAFRDLLDVYESLARDVGDDLRLAKLPVRAAPSECLKIIGDGLASMKEEISRLKESDAGQVNLRLKCLRLQSAVDELQEGLDDYKAEIDAVLERIEISRSTLPERTELSKKTKQAADATNERLQRRLERDTKAEQALTARKGPLEAEVNANEGKILSARGRVGKLRAELRQKRQDAESNDAAAVRANEHADLLEGAQGALEEKLARLDEEMARGVVPDARSVDELKSKLADVVAAKNAELAARKDQREKNLKLAAQCEVEEQGRGELNKGLDRVHELTVMLIQGMELENKSKAAGLKKKEEQLAFESGLVANLEQRLAILKRDHVPKRQSESAREKIRELKERIALLEGDETAPGA